MWRQKKINKMLQNVCWRFLNFQIISKTEGVVRCILPKTYTGKNPFYIQKKLSKNMDLRFDGNKYKVGSSEHFPVIVYEKKITISAKETIKVSCYKESGSWTVPDFNQSDVPEHVVIGDTGCKASKQSCNGDDKANDNTGQPKWHYPSLTENILTLFSSSSNTGQFIIHVGDYVYQGSNGLTFGTKAGTKDLSKTADWTDWEADFFAPSKETS